MKRTNIRVGGGYPLLNNGFTLNKYSCRGGGYPLLNNGFTLVELLAVIIILSLLALIASTAVTKIVKDTKEDLYKNQLTLIKSAAENWGAANLLKLPDAGELST